MRNKNSKVSDPNSFVSNPGTEEEIVYDATVLPDGQIELKPAGLKNIKEYINSFRESTDISYIVQRLKNGDLTDLNLKEGFYADMTKMPKTRAEFLQLFIDMERKFNELPLEIRNKFDNNYRNWYATGDTEEWYVKMNLLQNEDEKKGEPEDKE